MREEIDTALPTPGRERDDLAERMTIVVTELTTNALRHGRSAAYVQLSRSATAFVLDVADDAPQILDGGAVEAGGRGLHISHELASGKGLVRRTGPQTRLGAVPSSPPGTAAASAPHPGPT